ncbi:MAG: AarF/UbiB family protein, partial [Desertimonas sp.]
MKARHAAAAIAGTVGVGAAAAAAGKRLGITMQSSWRSRRLLAMTARGAGRLGVSKARRLVTPAERRAELDLHFAVRTAEDVAAELGEMKGVLMKVGQLISFIVEALPDEAQQALSALQANAAPMAPSLAAEVVTADLGADPVDLFAEWEDMPVAAASIGQVHR